PQQLRRPPHQVHRFHQPDKRNFLRHDPLQRRQAGAPRGRQRGGSLQVPRNAVPPLVLTNPHKKTPPPAGVFLSLGRPIGRPIISLSPRPPRSPAAASSSDANYPARSHPRPAAEDLSPDANRYNPVSTDSASLL